jgi:hypothetical protein
MYRSCRATEAGTKTNKIAKGHRGGIEGSSALLPLLYSFHLPYGTSGPSPDKSVITGNWFFDDSTSTVTAFTKH